MTNSLKNYRFLLLALLLLVIGLIAYLSSGTPGATDPEGNFQLQRGTNVVRIELIGQGSEEVILERTSYGWVVNSYYKANEAAIVDLLATMRNLIIRFPVPLADRPDVLDEMNDSGIQVDIITRAYLVPVGDGGLFPRQRRIRSILVGNDTPDGQGTFMKIRSAENPYVIQVPGLAGGLREIFLPREHLWRDPVLINFGAEQISEVRVSWPQLPAESFILKTTPEGIRMIAAEGDKPLEEAYLNQQRLLNYLNGFTNLYYEQLLTGSAEQLRDSLMVPYPFMVLEVKSHDQPDSVSLTFFRSLPPAGSSLQYDPDRFYIRLNDDLYAMGQYFVFGRIIRPLSFFIADQR